MYLLRRFKNSLILLLAICIVAGFGFVKSKVLQVSSKTLNTNSVIIDPGHGGFDGGAGAADGTLEKDINLKIAQKTRDILALSGFNVIMTRAKDTGTEDNSDTSISLRKKSDLKNRLELMEVNSDGIYVSIHLNKFTTSAARGTQVFYTPNFDNAKTLGEFIQSTVIENLQPDNHRVIKRGSDNTYLLKNAKIPAVIVECGFLSNKSDLDNLKDDSYQKKIALCIAAGIMKYYAALHTK